MRKPKHIRDLESLGKSYADLSAFRRSLEGFRITLCWNDSQRTWIFGKVPRTGPASITCKVGPESLVAMMADPLKVARQFEEIEHGHRGQVEICG